jgi:hypothetical protein
MPRLERTRHTPAVRRLIEGVQEYVFRAGWCYATGADFAAERLYNIAQVFRPGYAAMWTRPERAAD